MTLLVLFSLLAVLWIVSSSYTICWFEDAGYPVPMKLASILLVIGPMGPLAILFIEQGDTDETSY